MGSLRYWGMFEVVCEPGGGLVAGPSRQAAGHEAPVACQRWSLDAPGGGGPVWERSRTSEVLAPPVQTRGSRA